MISIKIFQVGYLQTNCYLITSDKTEDAILIDVGGGYNRISAYINEIGKKIVGVLFTHGHFDHILDAYKWQKSGAEIYIGEDDAEMLRGEHSLAKEMGLTLPPVTPDVLLEDKQKIIFGEMIFEVLKTPGHTKGGVCYILNDKFLFSGDTLFYHSYGRTDFYGGDFAELSKSVKRILAIDGDMIVYPGHGEDTTLAEERKFNPLL